MCVNVLYFTKPRSIYDYHVTQLIWFVHPTNIQHAENSVINGATVLIQQLYLLSLAIVNEAAVNSHAEDTS